MILQASLGALSITPPCGDIQKACRFQSHQVVVLGVVRTLKIGTQKTVPLRCHNLTTVQRWNFKPTEILKPRWNLNQQYGVGCDWYEPGGKMSCTISVKKFRTDRGGRCLQKICNILCTCYHNFLLKMYGNKENKILDLLFIIIYHILGK